MDLGGRSSDTLGSGQTLVPDMEKCGARGHSNGSTSESGGGHRWCLIESDPGVFTELVEKLGVQGVAFEEVFGLDEGSFAMIRHRKPLHTEKGWKGTGNSHSGGGRKQLEGRGTGSGGGDQQQKVDVDMQEQQTHEEGVIQECLEQESLEQDEKEEHLRKIFGFIFLFNWSKDKKSSGATRPHRSPASAAAGAAALARQQRAAKETSKIDGEGEASSEFEGAQEKETHKEKTTEQQQIAADEKGGSQSGWSSSYPEKLFFAKQVIPNACASQAILAVLINKRENICDVGPTVNAFVEFTKDFRDPYMRGEAIGNSDAIREAHNSFKGSSPFDWAQEDDADEKEDAFHFVSYICFEGNAYEIDGLEDAPKCLGPCTEKNWTELVRQQLLHRVARIQEKASGELRFNLMAVVEDELYRLKKEIARQRLLAQRANVKRICLGEDLALEDEEVDDDDDDHVDVADVPSMEQLPEDLEQLKTVVQQAKEKKRLLEFRELEELDVRARWKKENIRRRHDFVPFVLCILRHVARRGELLAAVEAAREIAARRRQAKREKQSPARTASPAASERNSGKRSG